MSLRDAVYGLAVGDAFGVPYEFQGRDTFEVAEQMTGGGIHDQEPGTFSDDTSMTLATCASIMENNGLVDANDILEKFADWAYRGEYAIDGNVFDIGSTVSAALQSGFGQCGEYDNGNGSLMRIVPLAFTSATDDKVRLVSAITHAHFVAADTCVDYVHAACDLEDGASIQEVVEEYAPQVLSMSRDDVKSGGYVVDTFNAAMWCLANADNYKDAVMLAVGLGGDTDTTAAVTGALAGIAYGCDSIPSEWMAALRGKDIIESCIA